MGDNNTDILIFDLGGVLLDLDLDGAFRRLSAQMDRKIDDLNHAYAALPFIAQYEIGAIDTETFYRRFREVFNNEVSMDEFRALWFSMLVRIPPERVKWLKRMRDKYSLVLLSNTNALHVEHAEAILRRDTGVRAFTDIFNKTYYSHLMHMRKPDINCFEHVLNDLNVAPSSCVFLDDSSDNISAAEQLGMRTVLVPYNNLSEQHVIYADQSV